MNETKYLYREDYGCLKKYENGQFYSWHVKKKEWAESPNCRIYEPDSDASFWYDEITEEQAKDIMTADI